MTITRKIIHQNFVLHKRLLRKSVTLASPLPLHLLYPSCQLFYMPLQKGTFLRQQLLIC